MTKYLRFQDVIVQHKKFKKYMRSPNIKEKCRDIAIMGC